MFGAYRHKARLEKLIRQWTDYRDWCSPVWEPGR